MFSVAAFLVLISRITWTGLIRNGLDYLVHEGYVDKSNRRTKRAYEALEDPEVDGLLDAANIVSSKHRFRLRGIRTQQLPGRQTKTTQYRVVWGEHLNRSDSWVSWSTKRTFFSRPNMHSF
jgi:hypothetical protein